MPMSQPDASGSSEDRVTPDDLLHTRTGTDVSPEDLVLATGRDITPHSLEWAYFPGPKRIKKALEKVMAD